MESPLLDTCMLLEKKRNRLVTVVGLNGFIMSNEIDKIEWCDIRTGGKGPLWCYPCQTITRCMGGCFECAVTIATCGLCMDDSKDPY